MSMTFTATESLLTADRQAIAVALRTEANRKGAMAYHHSLYSHAERTRFEKESVRLHKLADDIADAVEVVITRKRS